MARCVGRIPLASPTLMGVLLREDPASRRMLRTGRRAGTIRARVRSIRNFLAWLAAAHELPYPTTHMHLMEFFTSAALRALSKRSNQTHARSFRLHGGAVRCQGEASRDSAPHLDQEGAHGGLVSNEAGPSFVELSKEIRDVRQIPTVRRKSACPSWHEKPAPRQALLTP